MRCLRESRVPFLLSLTIVLTASHSLTGGQYFIEPGHPLENETELSVVHPFKVDVDGQFISHSVSQHFEACRKKRDQRNIKYVYYKVDYKGRELTFNLSVNNNLIPNDYILEKRNGSHDITEHRSTIGNSCHLFGTVTDSSARGIAALSTCKGLRGLFTLPEGHFFIEPAKDSPGDVPGNPQPHLVYPRVANKTHRQRRSTEPGYGTSNCGVRDSPEELLRAEVEREEWEREQQMEGAPPRSKRSVSRERWVETMVVADAKLIDYHGSDNVESYIFTIMNMVAGIFHDASIGNAIHIVLVRLILLQGDEKDLKIVYNADTTLGSFCAWQKNLNPQSDTHPAHHDVAVLVTRTDLCAGMDQPCETLGLSHLSGLCQPYRCCNINEDTGLPVAFTIAHELGHSLGIHHDGQGNDCELKDRHPFIMSRQLIYDSSPLTWSTCSKEYITRFLDRGWGHCLDDRPSKRDFTTPLARLGVRYTTHHQCQLQYGQNATYCPEIDNVCQILWCSVNNTCRSKLDSPVDGTRCGPEKWCISGECVIVGKLPETVSGGWGEWGTWSHCSRTCGAGIQSAERECNNPKPVFGGKYCTGERRRYRTCNTKPCQKNTPTFREMLCSEFDTVPYQNELYKWIPISSPSTPCELHCRPVSEHFSERMLDAVTDGTPCFMNNNSRNICVNGVCKEVGCDFGLNSNALEDRCGICLGDGTACETIQQTFEGEADFGYVDVGLIPEGARDILVQEMGEAGNFLALRGQGSEDYYLNGNYIIQWNGEYEAGGTTFYYKRSGNLENLTAPGPTKRSVMLQLLYQERNPGIKYEYTVKKSTTNGIEVAVPVYKWKHGAWTDCSTTCGAGEQQQPVRCFEFDMGVVEDSLCVPEHRPENRHRKCKNMDCPARWWVGGWQQCTATCGSEGMRKRTVLCVRTVAGEERVLHPVECKHLLKPKPVVPCNRDVPCGQEWDVGPWSECPVTCGGSVCSRTVTCRTAPLRSCDPLTKPRSKSLCGLQSCPSTGFRIGPGLTPKYRRIYPPKSQPSSRPVSHTHGPESTSTAATTTMPTTSRQRTTTTLHTSTSSTTAPYRIDADDYELAENGGDSQSTKENPTDKDKNYDTNEKMKEEHEEEEEKEEEEEEGSASDVVASTPSYDYEVEDRTTLQEGIIDLDIFITTPPLWTSSLSHRSAQPHTTSVYPTVRKPPYSDRTKSRVTSTTTPFTRRTSPAHWAKTTRRSPLSNPNTTPSINPYTQRTPRVPHTTPRPSGTSRVPFAKAPVTHPTTLRKIPTPSAPQPTIKILKAKKSVVVKSSPPHTKNMAPSSKGSPKSSRSPDQTPGSPVVSPTSTYDNGKARAPISKHVRWLTGNWSECSTTCGMGAVWRIVTCSSSRDEDCASLTKPEPARICHLRPCATWKSSNWTKCPEECELVGRRQRDVQCVDTSSKRPLRPFHCRALSSPPPSSLTCPSKSCLVWSTSPWGLCSGSCGEGMRERMVFCPEFKRCSATRRPDTSESCSLPPCPHWEAQDWQECSMSCGGGVQHRVVTCVTEDSVPVRDNHLCEMSKMPLTHQKCNIQECMKNTGSVCKKNSMSPRFCQKLRLLGRCSLRSVQKQCCATCQE